VTLVNGWWARVDANSDEAERHALVSCDGCLPPRVMIGYTAAHMSAVGWEFEELERGPHLCPACARRRPHRGPRRRARSQKRPALPNLLIIGAGKCGTSSLHRYLAAHPQVFMSEVKEMCFFQDPSCLDKLDTYATFFDGNAPLRGESSPAYSVHPLAPGTSDRIRAVIPDVRLIYLVRDPVERTVSQYVERQAQGGLQVPLEEALGDLADPHNPFITPSRYATQLEQYLRLFPREQLLVIDQTELLVRRGETLRGLFRFLGVGEGFWSPRYVELHNPRERQVRWTRTARRLADSRMFGVMRRLVPDGPRRTVVAPVKRATTTKLEEPILEEGLRRRLRDVCGDEVERLRELTGKRFATWQV
jgi:hypothetical protein